MSAPWPPVCSELEKRPRLGGLTTHKVDPATGRKITTTTSYCLHCGYVFVGYLDASDHYWVDS